MSAPAIPAVSNRSGWKSNWADQVTSAAPLPERPIAASCGRKLQHVVGTVKV